MNREGTRKRLHHRRQHQGSCRVNLLREVDPCDQLDHDIDVCRAYGSQDVKQAGSHDHCGEVVCCDRQLLSRGSRFELGGSILACSRDFALPGPGAHGQRPGGLPLMPVAVRRRVCIVQHFRKRASRMAHGGLARAGRFWLARRTLRSSITASKTRSKFRVPAYEGTHDVRTMLRAPDSGAVPKILSSKIAHFQTEMVRSTFVRSLTAGVPLPC